MPKEIVTDVFLHDIENVDGLKLLAFWAKIGDRNFGTLTKSSLIRKDKKN